ncbi:MAG: HU family DNA-binding protein [Vicinamibacterales bacterium]
MAKTKKPARKSAASAVRPVASIKPVKDVLSKSALIGHLATHSGVEKRGVKAVLGALEATIAAALSKKGARKFTLPGVLKATAVSIPAKPKRMGKDPFTGEERMFAAKPATVRVKIRALKKLKDAAL